MRKLAGYAAVEHEQLSSLRDRNKPLLQGHRVEKQHRIPSAKARRHLVHDAACHARMLNFGALGQLRHPDRI